MTTSLATQVVSAYQPIHELSSNRVIGYEALARFDDPSLSDVSRVFQDARDGGYLAELDWDCRLAAFRGAFDAGLTTDHALFVNVEPSSLRLGAAPVGFDALLERAERELRVVIELNERSLIGGTADLLWLVDWARRRGWGIALDDVGAHPDVLGLLPFIAPDIVKLDLRLIDQAPSREQARTVTAVLAYAERRGALILAEGIETDDQLDQAKSLGATLGQGWLLGRPGPLTPIDNSQRVAFHPPTSSAPETPFALVAGSPSVRVARKRMIEPLCRWLEIQATSPMDPPVVLSVLPAASQFTVVTARDYAELARLSPMVAAFAVGMPVSPAPGVQGVALSSMDPMARERCVVLVGSHHAAALIARDLGDGGPEQNRRFEYVVTHDWDTVVAAGRSMLSRLVVGGGR